MLVIVRRVWYVFVGIGAMTLWLSTNSIPDAVKDADGFWATNLRHLGWDNPPQALATTAADNIGVIVGIVLLVFGVICLCAWLWEKFMRKKISDFPSGNRNYGRIDIKIGPNATGTIINGNRHYGLGDDGTAIENDGEGTSIKDGEYHRDDKQK